MKSDQFNKELRNLADGYHVSVKEDLFNQLMTKRSQKKRKYKFIIFGSTAAALTVTMSLLFLLNDKNFHSISLSTTNSTDPKKTEQQLTSPSSEKYSTLTNINNNPTASVSKPSTNNISTKEFDKRKVIAQQPIRFNVNHNSSSNVILSSTQTDKIVTEKYVNDQEDNLEKLNDDNLTHASKALPQGTSSDSSEIIVDAKRLLPDTTLVVSETTPKISDSTAQHTIVKHPNNTKPWNVNGSFMIGINASYFPFNNARNQALEVPGDCAEKLGILPDPKSVTQYGISVGFSLNNWMILSGVSIMDIKYEDIRYGSYQSEIANYTPGSSFGMDKKNWVDREFQFIELPIQLNYLVKLPLHFQMMFGGGLVQQWLIRNTSYCIVTNDNLYNYHYEVDDITPGRLRSSVQQYSLQSGVQYTINNKFIFSTAIQYRRNILSIYREESTRPYFVGFLSSVHFKF
jgi:hypothetical protein